MPNESANFDRVIDRSEVPTLKFDGDMMESIFGDRDLWPSWVADMDFAASEKIQDALARRVRHGVYGYESSGEALPAAVAAWYRDRHGWQFDPQQLLFTPRTLTSIAALIRLFSEPGDGVITQPPVFYDFKMIINANGRRLIKNPLRFDNGRYRMDFENLEAVTADPRNSLLILCNPHNPIGRVWSRADLTRLADICRANDVFVIADEIHGDITYGVGFTPLASLSPRAADNCASCISPVKSFNLAGVANSMLVLADAEKRSRVKDWFSHREINKNNIFSTAAMLAAYTEGAAWLDRVTGYLQGNVDTLGIFLRENIPSVRLVEPEGTYLLWLDFRELGLDARQLETFLVQKARIAGNPGHWFGREGAGFARINIACPRSRLLQALENLRSAVEQL